MNPQAMWAALDVNLCNAMIYTDNQNYMCICMYMYTLSLANKHSREGTGTGTTQHVGAMQALFYNIKLVVLHALMTLITWRRTDGTIRMMHCQLQQTDDSAHCWLLPTDEGALKMVKAGHLGVPSVTTSATTTAQRQAHSQQTGCTHCAVCMQCVDILRHLSSHII